MRLLLEVALHEHAGTLAEVEGRHHGRNAFVELEEEPRLFVIRAVGLSGFRYASMRARCVTRVAALCQRALPCGEGAYNEWDGSCRRACQTIAEGAVPTRTGLERAS